MSGNGTANGKQKTPLQPPEGRIHAILGRSTIGGWGIGVHVSLPRAHVERLRQTWNGTEVIRAIAEYLTLELQALESEGVG